MTNEPDKCAVDKLAYEMTKFVGAMMSSVPSLVNGMKSLAPIMARAFLQENGGGVQNEDAAPEAQEGQPIEQGSLQGPVE